MKCIGRIAIFVVCTLIALQVSAKTDKSFYLVTHVVDGDTFDAETIGRIRLIGVDTPETKHPKKPVEHFGIEASNFLKAKISGKKVRLEYDWQRKDKYNRTLAYAYLEDGTFINAEIIEKGYGFAYTRFPFKHIEKFRELEKDARTKSRGLWQKEKTSTESDLKRKAKKVSFISSFSEFNCMQKKTCSQIRSCKEAVYRLETCHQNRLDRDNDGIPCESLCKLTPVKTVSSF